MISLHKNIFWLCTIISLTTLPIQQSSAKTAQRSYTAQTALTILNSRIVQTITEARTQITKEYQAAEKKQSGQKPQSLLNGKGKRLLTAKKFNINSSKIWKYFNHPLLKQYLKDSLEVMENRCAEILKSAYMAQNLIEIRNDIPEWEGYPVKLYEYYTGKDIKIDRPKKGKVLMLNPSKRQLALWIITAVVEAKSAPEYKYLTKLSNFIKWQSGAQFPVSGVVYEDMYTKGFYEPYLFKDGVTVYVADPSLFPLDKTCTEEQLNFYLKLKNSDLKPNTGRYARICSTNRDMYYAAGGTEEVGDNNDNRKQEWLRVVRKLYQKAWNAPENELIIAWAKANL
jgi:hypothetical protein